MFLALFVKKRIFAYLTLKLTFWPWRWPYIIKIIQEMDCPVKITWKWGITLVPGFNCWKIIFDLEIFGGHFVFALKKFRPRVPKWHPADSCSGHPLEPESIIKHRPYRETRLSRKKSFDNWTTSVHYFSINPTERQTDSLTNKQTNTIKTTTILTGFFRQNPTKKRYYTCS